MPAKTCKRIVTIGYIWAFRVFLNQARHADQRMPSPFHLKTGNFSVDAGLRWFNGSIHRSGRGRASGRLRACP